MLLAAATAIASRAAEAETWPPPPPASCRHDAAARPSQRAAVRCRRYVDLFLQVTPTVHCRLRFVFTLALCLLVFRFAALVPFTMLLSCHGDIIAAMVMHAPERLFDAILRYCERCAITLLPCCRRRAFYFLMLLAARVTAFYHCCAMIVRLIAGGPP